MRKRGRGAVRHYLGDSPEEEQTVAMLYWGRGRRCRARAGELELWGGSPGDGEQVSVVEGARRGGGWPELELEFV